VIYVDEVMDLAVGKSLLPAHEPVIDRLLGKIIEQVAHVRLVDGWMERKLTWVPLSSRSVVRMASSPER